MEALNGTWRSIASNSVRLVGGVMRLMRCAGCGKPVGAAWLVIGPTLNERVRPRRVALLGSEARG